MALTLDLVTPEKLLYSKEVDMVVVPGMEGDFGVLEGHSLLISSLRAGVISIYDNDNVSERVFVSGGFAEVTGECCTVLATEAVNLSDISIEDAENQLKDANENLLHTETEQERSFLEEKVTSAKALIEALSN